MILRSLITCPECGTAKLETMPTDSCWHFYECGGCGMLLRPKPGECCVFCSYGSVSLPAGAAGGRGYAFLSFTRTLEGLCDEPRATPAAYARPCGRRSSPIRGRLLRESAVAPQGMTDQGVRVGAQAACLPTVHPRSAR